MSHDVDPRAPTTAPLTCLLRRWSGGDPAAGDQVAALLYDDLRRVAAGCFHGERASHTLQPTALVHEAWLRLEDAPGVDWQGRGHFLSVAARVMRRVLVDHARRHGAAKRGSGRDAVPLDEELAIPAAGARDPDLLALDQALQRLEQEDPQGARLVELRFFAGATIDEAAACLEVSRKTASRMWRRVRAELYLELAGEPAET